MAPHRLKHGVVAFCLASAGLWTPAALASGPDVVVSVKPIHSLVSAVMDGVAEPTLLVQGGSSPHTYSLRPSDARALSEADLVFWIGDVFETFLVHSLETLADDAEVVAMIDAPGMTLLENRAGGAWETHADEHDDGEEGDHDHGHGPVDGHIWLDPGNAQAIVELTVAELSEYDPANAEAYRANGAAAVERIEALEAELRARLAPVRERPYVVFHDAYQYFEAAFDLNAVGSITVSPESQPGARRLAEMREEIQARNAGCVFSEPQFEPQLVDTVTEGLPVGRGVLDPEGMGLEPGPDLYHTLMRDLAAGLTSCLEAG